MSRYRRRRTTTYDKSTSASKAASLVVKNFDTVGDYVDYVASQEPRAGVHATSNSRGPCDWNGKTGSFDDAVALVRTGWPEGAAKVAEWRNRLGGFLSAATAAKSKSFAWDVTGDFVDVGRYLTGEPECCGSEQDYGESNKSRVVSIRLNNCVSGSLSGDCIVARGVAVLVAVDLLESLGIRVEVVVGQATSTVGRGADAGSTPGLHLDANVVAKRAAEPVDVDRLAYVIAHPAYFRRLGFKFCEINGHSPCGCSVADMSDKGSRPGVIEIDGVLSATGLNESELRDNVLEIVKACGVEFTSEQLAEIAATTV